MGLGLTLQRLLETSWWNIGLSIATMTWVRVLFCLTSVKSGLKIPTF